MSINLCSICDALVDFYSLSIQDLLKDQLSFYKFTQRRDVFPTYLSSIFKSIIKSNTECTAKLKISDIS